MSSTAAVPWFQPVVPETVAKSRLVFYKADCRFGRWRSASRRWAGTVTVCRCRWKRAVESQNLLDGGNRGSFRYCCLGFGSQ